jgi:hypothetical protein
MNSPHPKNALSGLFGGIAPISEERKRVAWARTREAGFAGILAGEPGDEARLDDFGNIILWSKYGDYSSEHGWEIDHQQPSALGGSDHHSNLRALSCRANRGLGGILGAIMRGQR